MKPSWLISLVALSLGCRSVDDDRGKPELPAAARSAAPVAADTNDGPEKLDQLDQRRPLPLLPMMAQHQKQNMREHLEAVQEVVSAAAVGDFEKVAVAGRRMGFSESMGRMCEHMGAAAPGFTEQALSFHHTADKIAVAAARQDVPAVLGALSETLRACTSCHATYKQRPVTHLPE